jgi:putative SOS response-associated peptidase YedK
MKEELSPSASKWKVFHTVWNIRHNHGLWERWRDPETAEPVLSYAIITTSANPVVAEVHDRMPVILEPENWERWISSQTPAMDLLKPWEHEMLMKEVTPRMNKVSFQGPDCHEPDCPPQTELPLNSL